MNDDQRLIGAAFPLFTLFTLWSAVARQAAGFGDDEDVAKQNACEAMQEYLSIFELCDEKKKRNLQNRLMRLHSNIIDDEYAERPIKSVAIILYYLIVNLTRYGFYMHEDSLSCKLVDCLLQSIDQEADDFGKVTASAQKQADKILKKLQENGFFTEEVEDVAA
jgi:hypothetical protein